MSPCLPLSQQICSRFPLILVKFVLVNFWPSPLIFRSCHRSNLIFDQIVPISVLTNLAVCLLLLVLRLGSNSLVFLDNTFVTITSLTPIFFSMFSFNSGVTVLSLLYSFDFFLFWESIFILDYFTSICNNYRHQYNYKFKKKKHKSNTLKLISNTYLLFYLTISTYTITAADLQGITLRFRVHNEVFLLQLCQTFNEVYVIDLYEPDVHFVFDDVGTNGLTKLYKEAPKQLLVYMTNCIEQELKSTTRDVANKVDDLFRNMRISFIWQSVETIGIVWDKT